MAPQYNKKKSYDWNVDFDEISIFSVFESREDICICKTVKVLTSLTSHQLCGEEAKCFGSCNLLLPSNLESKMLTRFPSYPVPVEKRLTVVVCPAWAPPVSSAPPLPFFCLLLLDLSTFQMAGSHAALLPV